MTQLALKSITKDMLFVVIFFLSTPGNIHAYISSIARYQQYDLSHGRKTECSRPSLRGFPTSHIFKSSFKPTLSMALIFAPLSDLSKCLVLGVPTGEQYSTYWGRTSRERVNAIFESCAVTFLGLFASYFLSFVIGSSLATVIGMVAAFWTLLGPQWKAYQRNWELIGGRKLVDPYRRAANDDDEDFDDFIDDDEYEHEEFSKVLYGAYYIASVKKVAVVENSLSPKEDEYDIRDFYDYNMERDENEITTGCPWMLRLLIGDRSGRNMQVHARMSENYVKIREGMPCASILLSTDKSFSVLSGLTDFYIPDARCCVGDYPYLDKLNFGRILKEKRLFEIFDEEDQQLNNVDNGTEEDDDVENWIEQERIL